MSSSPINLANSYLQSILTGSIQNSSSTNGTGNVGGITVPSTSDSNQLSPFAQLLSTLQQLQQSNPAQYQQLTQQIATNLQNAAQTAQSEGKTSAATQLNQLATDFTNASKSGQLPNIQDLAQAVGGHHHHHHHHGGGAPPSGTDADANTSTSASASGSTSTTSSNSILSQFQNGASQSDSLNPLNIILGTLSSAGITGA